MSVYLPIAEMNVNVLLIIILGIMVGGLTGLFGVGGGFDFAFARRDCFNVGPCWLLFVRNNSCLVFLLLLPDTPFVSC